jgi:integrase
MKKLEDAFRLLDAADPDEYSSIARHGGARISEVLGLKWKHGNLDAATIKPPRATAAGAPGHRRLGGALYNESGR